MSDKVYLDAQVLLEDSFRLGAEILKSGFKPTLIIAIWRGGAPMGIAVQELLSHYGVESDHIAIRTSSYRSIDERQRKVRIHGLNYLIKNVQNEDSLLIVDDVFDTGNTIQAVINELKQKTRLNAPHDIRVAVPYYKPTRNQTDLVPDYYLHTTDEWLKYPHSLEGLTKEEIAHYRPEIDAILGDRV